MIARQGHITPVWQDEYIHFNYVKQPIKDSEIDTWKDKGYYHKSFSMALGFSLSLRVTTRHEIHCPAPFD